MSEAAPQPPEIATDDDLSTLIGYNLKRVYGILHSEVVPVLAAFNLRTVSFSALSVIMEAPGVNQTQLAAALNIERSNLVQIIDELVAQGLIERRPVKEDRRRYALMPKPKGAALFAEAKLALQVHEQAFFAGLSDADRAHLRRILAQLRAR